MSIVTLNHLYAFKLSLQKLKLFHLVGPCGKMVDSRQVMLN